jgi:hypothetical protein
MGRSALNRGDALVQRAWVKPHLISFIWAATGEGTQKGMLQEPGRPNPKGRPDLLEKTLPCRQKLHGVNGFAQFSDLKVQTHLFAVGVTHFSNFLPFFDGLIFFHQ